MKHESRIRKETEKMVLDAKIFRDYQNGNTVTETATKHNKTWLYVNNMFYDWDKQKETVKKEVDEVSEFKFTSFYLPPNKNFVLCSTNEKVLMLANKLGYI